ARGRPGPGTSGSALPGLTNGVPFDGARVPVGVVMRVEGHCRPRPRRGYRPPAEVPVMSGVSRPAVRSKSVLAITLMLVLLAAGACGAGENTRPVPPVPVAVDTDLGADDIIAILYLLGRPEVDIVSVTVVGDGLVHCPTGVTNARAILAAAGRGDIPVACGARAPIAAAVAFPDAWRTQADGFYGMAEQWDAPTTATAAMDAEEMLVA